MTKKDSEQLKQQLDKLEEEWMNLKIDLRMGKLKDVHLPRKKRKEIARIRTKMMEEDRRPKAEDGKRKQKSEDRKKEQK